jgi:hypothetical protein
MKENDVVKFHTPLSDENPADRYLLVDDPEECRRHAENVNKAYPNPPPMKARVDLEYLGKVVDGKLVPTTMYFRPIQTVNAEDLAVDPSFVYESRGPDFAIVQAPA